MKVLILDIANKEFKSLDSAVQDKFRKIIGKLLNGDKIDKKLFKKLSGNLYELRVKHKTDIYRGMGAMDKEKFIIVLFFKKKSRRMPISYLQTSKERFNRYKVK